MTSGTSASVDLLPGQIHILAATLDRTHEEIARLIHLLSYDERERFHRFRFEIHRLRFLVGRAMLRRLLSTYTGIPPQGLIFARGVHGKLFLTDHCGGGGIRFNLSHSRGMALYAVARDREVGVDLEWVRPISELDRLAEVVFAPAEREAMRRADPSNRVEHFFTFWVRKEAYVKALGSGLTVPLDRVDVSHGGQVRVLDCSEAMAAASRWQVRDVDAVPGYLAALAAEGDDWQPVYRPHPGLDFPA